MGGSVGGQGSASTRCWDSAMRSERANRAGDCSPSTLANASSCGPGCGSSECGNAGHIQCHTPLNLCLLSAASAAAAAASAISPAAAQAPESCRSALRLRTVGGLCGGRRPLRQYPSFETVSLVQHFGCSYQNSWKPALHWLSPIQTCQ
jgi:hypothetical protein